MCGIEGISTLCGLIGLAGDCTVNMRDVFTELLLVDVVRGHHSTGAALVKRWNDEILVEKAPVPSPDFIRSQAYKPFIDTLDVKVMIGHNRYATIGEKIAENAHPFQFDNLVGAHNGTLDHWALNRLDNYKDFGTDSEALYYSVSKYGIRSTIDKISGAWALTWFDKQNNTINLLRNAKRPLYYAYSEDRCTIFWGSEPEMLEWILKRNRVHLFEKTVFACDADKHYRWAIPEKISTKFEKPIIAEVKECTFNHVQGFSAWRKGENWDHEKWAPAYGASVTPWSSPPKLPSPIALPPPKKTITKIDTKKFRPPYKDTTGQIITKPKFEELVASCCVFCDNANTVWGEFIYPLKDDMDGRKLYLCEDCYNDDDILKLIENSL